MFWYSIWGHDPDGIGGLVNEFIYSVSTRKRLMAGIVNFKNTY